MTAPEDKPGTVEDEAAEEAAPAEAETKPEGAQQETEVEAEVIEDTPSADADDSKSEDDGGSAAEGSEAAAKNEDDIFTAIKKEVTDLRDKYARLQAEWDNYRKRTAHEREAERVRASENLVKDLLPVLDDLERAIKHAKESGESESLTEGVEAIQTKFLQILEKHKVEQIEAQGQPFDAMKHQAVGTQEDASVPEETVVQVYQQGYSMGDKVLRPAMVVTSVGGPAQPPKNEEK